MRLSIVVTISTMVACSAAPTSPLSQGVFELQVNETSNELDMVGLADGAEISRAHIRLGGFISQDDGRYVDGLQMEITVAGETITHESEGFGRLMLPPPHVEGYRAFSEFLSDARVREVFARRQITFESTELMQPLALDPADVAAEEPYEACFPAPTTECGATSCTQHAHFFKYQTECSAAHQQYVCCGNTAKAAQRECLYTFVGATNPCGTEGPNGCAVCWYHPWSSSCIASTVASQNVSCSDADGTYNITAGLIQISYN
jgi:hypothetical protein